MKISNAIIEYAGGAFSKSLEKGRCSGTLTIAGNALVFNYGNETIELPLRDLGLKLGGAGNRIVYFTHPEFEGWSIYASGKSILSNQALLKFPKTREKISSIRKKSWLGLGIVFSILSIIFLGFLSLWLFRDSIIWSIAEQVPPSAEEQLGELGHMQIMQSEKELKLTPALQKDLDAMLDPLVNSIKDKRHPLKFYILNSDTVNAMALPNGYVYIYSGLLLKAETPEEIIGVIAHEIAHVNAQHSTRQLISQAGIFLILSALFGDVSSLSGIIINGSAAVLASKFSREFEAEADDIGWGCLVKANINPRGLITFFKKLQKMETLSQTDKNLQDWVGTHPLTSSRIADLEKRWNKLEKKDGFLKFDLDFKKFQERLEALRKK